MYGLIARQSEGGDEVDLQPGSPDDYSAGGLRAYLSVVTALSVLAVVLRFWSRLLSERGRQSFWWDDYMALICLVSLLVLEFPIGREMRHKAPPSCCVLL